MWPKVDLRRFEILKLPKSVDIFVKDDFYENIIDEQVRNDYKEAAELAMMLLRRTKRKFKKPTGDNKQQKHTCLRANKVSKRKSPKLKCICNKLVFIHRFERTTTTNHC